MVVIGVTFIRPYNWLPSLIVFLYQRNRMFLLCVFKTFCDVITLYQMYCVGSHMTNTKK